MTIRRVAVGVRDLRKAYGDRIVLDGVSFTVERGELVALLGPNGAGKTTTLEILEGYRRADAGEVRVLDLDPARAGAQLRPRLGLMLQAGGIDPRTTPREIVRLFARLFAEPADPDALLTRLGLAGVAGTRYRRLSGGEQQRVAFALALVGRPELLILDEPTAGLDPVAKATTRELIAELRADGTTILLTTHDLHEVERLVDRVLVLHQGRIALDGPPATLSSATPRLRFRLPQGAGAEVHAAVTAAVVRIGGAGARIVRDADGSDVVEGTRATPALIAAVTAVCAERDVLLTDLATGGASLERAYLDLVGSTRAAEPEQPRRLRA